MSHSDILKEVSSEAKLVLLIAKWLADNQDTSEIEDLLTQGNIEWKRFEVLIAYHELNSSAYLCLKKYSYHVPDGSIKLLENSYYYCLTHLSYLWKESKRVLNALRDKNIIALPLKGAAFIADNMYADKAYLRPMCDIDLLVKKKDLHFVKKTLERLGYEENLCGMRENYWREESYHLEFIRKRDGKPFYNVEMHWALDYKRARPVLPHLWDRVKEVQADGKGVYLLSPEDTLFCLALHQRRFGKALCLKNVCDAAMLLNRYSVGLDWNYIVKEAASAGMSTTLYFILVQAGLLSGYQAPGPVLKALNIPVYKKKLIKWFIARHTFSTGSGFNPEKENRNSAYLKSHFLLYDNLWEPVRYILNIPQEQFAKFYGLPPYAEKTNLLYRIRYLYFIKSFFTFALKIAAKRFAGPLKA